MSDLGTVLTAGLLACGLAMSARGATGPAELDIKAAFVLNFVRLVNWMDAPGEQNTAVLPICAVSKTDFFTAVRNTAAGKLVGNRVVTVGIEPVPDVTRCRVLIVDAPRYSSTRPVMTALRSAPILTVGNGAGFLDAGGILELIVEDNRVQFNVGMEAVRRSRLDISARLLKLSHNLRGGGASAY